MVPSRTFNIHGTLQSQMFFIVEKVSLDYEVFFTLRKMVLFLSTFHWKVKELKLFI